MSLATVMLTVLNNTQSPIMAIFKMRSSRLVARFQRRSIRYHSVILSLTTDYSFNNPQISYPKFTCMNYIIIRDKDIDETSCRAWYKCNCFKLYKKELWHSCQANYQSKHFLNNIKIRQVHNQLCSDVHHNQKIFAEVQK